MAKLTFSKLNLKINKDTKLATFNEQEIEVKQYLPVNDKLNMIAAVINGSADEMKFYNVGKIEVLLALEVILNYTNITFTDKQKEDPTKIYDSVVSSGLYDLIVSEIPAFEMEWIENTLMDTVENIYKFNNSVMGILETVSRDYSKLDLDITTIQDKISDPENLELLKSILTNLG